jgi:hypothetical protein
MPWQDIKITDDRGVIRIGTPGNVTDLVDLWGALKVFLGQRRGWDRWTIQHPNKDGTTTPVEFKVPLTTYADVVQMSIMWSTQVALNRRTREEMDGRRTRWTAAQKDVVRLAKGAQLFDVYPKNREWWSAAEDAAIAVDVEREAGDGPSRMDLVLGYVNNAPDAIGDALKWAGGKIEEGAQIMGKAAGAAARGFFDDSGVKELLIGGGVLLGAVLLMPILSNRKPARGVP